jgi:hypothetical protein
VYLRYRAFESKIMVMLGFAEDENNTPMKAGKKITGRR